MPADRRPPSTDTALTNARDTFDEFATALDLLGHHTMAEAARIARDGMAAALASNPPSTDTALAEALESIIVRCEEGDPRTDWRPTIARIARAALASRGSTDARDDYHILDNGLGPDMVIGKRKVTDDFREPTA